MPPLTARFRFLLAAVSAAGLRCECWQCLMSSLHIILEETEPTRLDHSHGESSNLTGLLRQLRTYDPLRAFVTGSYLETQVR
jgi:hypothetical protein